PRARATLVPDRPGEPARGGRPAAAPRVQALAVRATGLTRAPAHACPGLRNIETGTLPVVAPPLPRTGERGRCSARCGGTALDSNGRTPPWMKNRSLDRKEARICLAHALY